MNGDAWSFEHQVGDARGFHERELSDPTTRSVWWFEVERPTVVTGSAQPIGTVDADRAEAAGVEVVRRRSGGGAVWLAPGDATWVDLVIPAGDPLWDRDVGRSMHWVGALWSRVLADVGVGDLEVHRAGLVKGPWSDLVCFAGVGPGEVLAAGRKIVGISQRRQRAGARFQCAVLHRWDPSPLVSVLAIPDHDRARLRSDVADVAVGAAVDGEDLVASLVGHLEASARIKR